METSITSLVEDARLYAARCGFLCKTKAGHTVSPTFALFPSPIPRGERDFAASIQPDISLLIDRVSRDRAFLHESLQNVQISDQFIRRLTNIMDECWEFSQKKPTLALLRSDYLLDTDDGGRGTRVRQIEVNVIASSCSFFSEQLPHLHRFTLSLQEGKSPRDYLDVIPENLSNDGLVDAIALSWKTYGSPGSVVVTLVINNEANVYEISSIRHRLWEQHGIKNILLTFEDIIEGGPMEATLKDDRLLFIGGYEVAVVYYRSGYGIEHYPTDKHWKARLLLEKSESIQCPSVAQQLAGTKKVQQELTRPGVLERYFDDAAVLKRLRATFCRMYSLDKNAEGDEAVRLGIENPDNYVLKPQAEGGGHNIYGQDVKTFLEERGDIHSEYIMMERVYPHSCKNYVIRDGQTGTPQPVQIVNEVGIYGVYVRKGDDVLLNKVAGHVL